MVCFLIHSVDEENFRAMNKNVTGRAHKSHCKHTLNTKPLILSELQQTDRSPTEARHRQVQLSLDKQGKCAQF